MQQDIELKNIHKNFLVEGKPLEVLKDFNLTIRHNAITVILGKSGCGKTTLLRLIGGLDKDFEGTLTYPKEAKTGIVFQEPRLMPWLNVWKNITFGLKGSEIREGHIRRLISLTGLEGFENAKPSQLSGGMEQRVAIARALAVDPGFLLMDEPFAALDYFTRASMQKVLLDIHRQNSCGVLFITHSIDEALILGDYIVIIKEKQVKKVYHLKEKSVPADLSSRDMIDLKEDILININESKELSK